MSELSEKAKAFVEANAASPVVSGSAIGNGGQGARYTLRNGREFVLGLADCKAIGHPRWDLAQ